MVVAVIIIIIIIIIITILCCVFVFGYLCCNVLERTRCWSFKLTNTYWTAQHWIPVFFYHYYNVIIDVTTLVDGNNVLAIGVLSTNPNPKTDYSLLDFAQFPLMPAYKCKNININKTKKGSMSFQSCYSVLVT